MKPTLKMIQDVKFNRDFQKTFKVIESCKNETHIESASRYIDLFLKKWGVLHNEKSMKTEYQPILNELLNSKLKSLDI